MESTDTTDEEILLALVASVPITGLLSVMAEAVAPVMAAAVAPVMTEALAPTTVAPAVEMTDDERNAFLRRLEQFREIQAGINFLLEDDDEEEEEEIGEQHLGHCRRCGGLLDDDDYDSDHENYIPQPFECGICSNLPPHVGHISPELGFCRLCGASLRSEDYDSDDARYINQPNFCTQCSVHPVIWRVFSRR